VYDAAAPRELEDAHAPRRVALVVGVDRYEDPDLDDLRFAVADADGIGDLLDDPDVGAFDVVLRLTGEVNRAGFRVALDRLARTLERDDTFVLYFAGHGTLEAVGGTQLFLLLSDARLDDPRGTGLLLESLESELDGLRARRRVLIVDTCFSGAGRSALSERVRKYVQGLRGPPPPPPAREVSRFDARLFAAHYDEPAGEDEALGHGIYTYFLLQGLQGAGDMDGDGLVDAVEAHHFARDGTLNHTGGRQVPWLRTTVVGREAIYLAGDPESRTDAERAIITGLAALPRGALLLVDGQERGVGAVEPGRHTIEIQLDGERVYARPVRAKAGAWVDLEQLWAERVKPPVLLGGGVAVVASRQVSSPVLGQVVLWGWTRRKAGGRFGVGLAASVGYAPVEDQGPFVMGDALGRASWTFGGAFAAGPSIGVGMVWRLPKGFEQAGLLLAPGAHLRLMWDRGFVAVDPAVWLTPIEVEVEGDWKEQIRATFSVALTGGVRL